MKRYHAFLLVGALLFGLAGCSAAPNSVTPQTADRSIQAESGAAAPAEAPSPPGASPTTQYGGLGYGYIAQYDTDEDAVATGKYTAVDAKLIREANLSLESTEYDKAAADLDALVARCGGYYSESNRWGGAASDVKQSRSSDFTVRVPKDRYGEFMSAVGGVAHVVHRSESAVDVGSDYYDTELRLKTARVKHERLLALLEKADKMADIITVETSLAQVQYEIDQLSGTLRRYDGLVDHATIRLSLSEVIRLTETPTERDSFSTRIARATQGGASNFGAALSAFAEWFAYNLIGFTLLIAAAVVVLIVLRKRGVLKGKHPKEPPEA